MKKKISTSILLILVLLTITGCKKGILKKEKKPEVNIVKTEAQKVKFEKFDNGLIQLDIPKGWKVELPNTSGSLSLYTIKVYNPEKPNYMMFFALKRQGFLKSEKARSTYAMYYPDSGFAKLSPVDPQTTEAFYKVWDKNAALANDLEEKREYYPITNEFTVLETLGQSNLGGDIIRATYKNSSGEVMQGLFTATVKDVGSYMISTNKWNPFGPQVDVAPLNVYNIIFFSTPEAELNDWQEIFDHSLSSIVFTETFLQAFSKEEAAELATIQANQKIYDSISDMIMDSWNKRNASYDIISQKQSDATLGYERVYDTETGDVYKAYNGFTDEYKGNRYKAITDDMYTTKISGYIEK